MLPCGVAQQQNCKFSAAETIWHKIFDLNSSWSWKYTVFEKQSVMPMVVYCEEFCEQNGAVISQSIITSQCQRSIEHILL